MPPKSRADTRRAREEAQASIERIGSLLRAGSSEAAQALAREVDDAMPRLSANAQREIKKALREALATEPDSGAQLEAFSSADWRAVLDRPDETVTNAVSRLRDTIDSLDRAAKKNFEFAEFMFSQYAKFTHKGAPDIMANSQAARDFASEMKQQARAALTAAGMSEEDAERKVNAAWAGYKKGMSDFRARFANELDMDSLRERFPLAAKAYPDATPAEALSLYYELDLLGYSERQRRRSRISMLKAKLADASGKEATRLEQEILDIQASMGTASAGRPALDPVKTTRKAVRGVSDALSELDLDAIKELPAAERRVLEQTLPVQINRLTQMLMAARDTDDE